MADKPIAYEPHPVSPERRAELLKAGYRIVDAIYAPKDALPTTTATASQPADYRAQHRGKGRWYVMRGDEIISGPYAKDDVEAAVEREKAIAA
jgi:hypothetical protein